MRVGLAIDALSTQLTGIGRYTWNLCTGLAKNSEVSSLAFYRSGRWFRRPEWFLSHSHAPRARLPRALRRLINRSALRSRLFHQPNYLLPPDTGRAVITVHDLSVFRYPEFHPPARIAAFEQGFARSVAKADHIITDSEWIRGELADYAALPLDRITAVPLGVGPEFFRGSAEGDDKLLARYGLRGQNYVLCVATIEPRKALEKAILAFDQFVERTGSYLTLAIVGASGWQDGPLRERISRAERRGRVRLLGYVADADLPAVYAGARLFLFPSLYEGFGLPPLEAMASGVPVIISDRSCLPEVTRGTALQIDPEDIDAFACAIDRGLADDSWRAGAIEDGRQVAAGYTWRRCVDETVNVYRKVWTGRD